ncbi:MAG: ABC transporter ATP-binding protein [Sphingomicrobium sp.]
MTPLLDARDLALSGRLQPTSLSAASGELVAVIGPNGGGKTSLLRALADVEGEAGSVRICGEPLSSAPPARRSHLLSFLPASREVVWPIRARDVIALACPGLSRARIDTLADLLDLGGLADRPINSLSTGERARVLLARALACEPRLLLLDEPLSNLDPYWALRIVDILRGYVGRGHAALVAVHDLGQVDAFDRVLLVNQGCVVADAKPADLLGSELLSEVFGIERSTSGWKLSRQGRPRSSQ